MRPASCKTRPRRSTTSCVVPVQVCPPPPACMHARLWVCMRVWEGGMVKVGEVRAVLCNPDKRLLFFRSPTPRFARRGAPRLRLALRARTLEPDGARGAAQWRIRRSGSVNGAVTAPFSFLEESEPCTVRGCEVPWRVGTTGDRSTAPTRVAAADGRDPGGSASRELECTDA